MTGCIRTLMVLSLIFSIFKGYSQGQVEVTIDNFDSDKGVCKACIFSDAATYAGKGKPLLCKDATIQHKRTVIQFDQLSPGYYAIALFHDKNNNGQMDTNFLGIPKEGYGASKNKLPFAAAPKFEDNKFYITPGKVMTLPVKLRYIF